MVIWKLQHQLQYLSHYIPCGAEELRPLYELTKTENEGINGGKKKILLDRLAVLRHWPFKFCASFDLKKCYNQFLIKEADRTYAAFSTPFGNFMPTRVQFGFQGAPAFVQSHLSEALRAFPGCADFRLFIDDAAVGANSMEELNAKCEDYKPC